MGVQIASWKHRNPWTTPLEGLFAGDLSVLRLRGWVGRLRLRGRFVDIPPPMAGPGVMRRYGRVLKPLMLLACSGESTPASFGVVAGHLQMLGGPVNVTIPVAGSIHHPGRCRENGGGALRNVP
jgi:hypothetical protein